MMKTVNTTANTNPAGLNNPEATQTSAGLLDRVLDWMNHFVDTFFGPVGGDARHGDTAEPHLFMSPSCCGAIIDSDLWDLVTERQPQRKTQQASNV